MIKVFFLVAAIDDPIDDVKSEKIETCEDNMFTCSDGSCIHPETLCDGYKDCDDGSDEDEKECNKSTEYENPTEENCEYGSGEDCATSKNNFLNRSENSIKVLVNIL